MTDETKKFYEKGVFWKVRKYQEHNISKDYNELFVSHLIFEKSTEATFENIVRPRIPYCFLYEIPLY